MNTNAALEYERVAHTRASKERVYQYFSEEPLELGEVLRLDGRYWLVERVEPDKEPARVLARPARYRIRLRHPDGHEELGAFRRFSPDAHRLGHSFTTIEDGRPIGWEVANEVLAYDEPDELP